MKVLLVIKKIVYLFNIILVCLTILNFIDASDPILILSWSISFFLGLILSIITACFAGTPNNYLKEVTLLFFENNKLKSNKFIIEVKETEKSIWQVQDKYKTVLDMKGWIRQKKYIYELICMRFVLKAYNAGDQMALSLPFGTQILDIENLYVKFVDIKNKTHYYQIIKNGIVHKTLYMRYRLFLSMKALRTGPKEEKNYRHYHMALSDCYRFKLM